MRVRRALFALLLLAATAGGVRAQPDEPPRAPKGPLNTLVDIGEALRGCWKWPPLGEVRTGMDLTVLVSFKRNGEIFGARLTYQSKDVSPEERALYHGAMLDMLKLCSPLPVSDSLGNAIAGRPFTFRIHDNRREGKA
jgi:hypothetical protein